MKLNLNILIWGFVFFLSRGIMAEQVNFPFPQKWLTIKDLEAGLQVDFPQHPLEMSFDIPFQNIPPEGRVHLYSVPTPKGLLVLSSFHSTGLNSSRLEKEELHRFFETILVPHFFFNPAIFRDHQTFHFEEIEIEGQQAASFQFLFQDQGVVKKLEGIGLIKNQTLYIPFYLASEKDYEKHILDHFLKSIQMTSD